MPDRIKLLVAESETPDARARRRNGTGRSSAETFAATLAQLEPGAQIDLARPAEDGAPEWTADDLAQFDGIVLSGSPLHAWQDAPMVRRHLRFMRAAFAAATPCFGSCAGLQVAAVAAGGTVRAKPGRHEAGLARRITKSPAGRNHPLLDGRPQAGTLSASTPTRSKSSPKPPPSSTPSTRPPPEPTSSGNSAPTNRSPIPLAAPSSCATSSPTSSTPPARSAAASISLPPDADCGDRLLLCTIPRATVQPLDRNPSFPQLSLTPPIAAKPPAPRAAHH